LRIISGHIFGDTNPDQSREPIVSPLLQLRRDIIDHIAELA